MGWQNGTFRRLFSWTADAQAGYDILADRMDSDTNDIVGGVNNTLTRDGQNMPLANLPMSGFKHLNVAQASNTTDYARWDQVVKTDSSGNSTVTGTLTATGGIVANGPAQLNDSATVVHGLSTDTLTTSGNATVGNELIVNNGCSITGPVGVTGTGYFSSTLGCGGAFTCNSNASIAGNAGINGTATIGSANVQGNITAQTATVNGVTNVSSLNVNPGGNNNMPTVGITGNVSINGNGDRALQVTNGNIYTPQAITAGLTGGVGVGCFNAQGGYYVQGVQLTLAAKRLNDAIRVAPAGSALVLIKGEDEEVVIRLAELGPPDAQGRAPLLVTAD